MSSRAFLVSIALLALLMPVRTPRTAPQAQPGSLVALALGEAEGPPPAPDRARVAEALRSSPIMFIENVGQFDERARFQLRGGMGTMWLAEDAIWITLVERSPVDTLKRFDMARANVEREDEPLRGVNLKLSFPGANPHPRIEPFGRLDTVVSYFIGKDPDQWHPDVPVWGGARYVDLYPGVDLEITSASGNWTWQLVFRNQQSEINTPEVRLRVEGADTLTLDGDRLCLTTALADFTLPLLRAVTTDGTPLDLTAARPEVNGTDITSPFSLSPPLSLSSQDNPDDLLYSTFLGGSGDDYGEAISLDAAGSTYVTGYTYSSDFPSTAGAFDTSYNGGIGDAFVVKMNASGTDPAYATFLGGSDYDRGYAIAVDGAGSAYATGYTYSSDFPTTAGAFDTDHNGYYDAFMVKLNASGTDLAYATFLGGNDDDRGHAIAVDGVGCAYVAGMTGSSDFPTTAGAFDTGYNGWHDAFMVKLNGSGTDLAYATFLGGSGSEMGYAITVDGAACAYVAGWTTSSDFPTTVGAFDTSYNGGYYDAFVVKVNADGSALAYATFLGGSHWDEGDAIAVGEAGCAYVAGWTESPDFPTTAGAFDTSYNGNRDAFVVKVNAGGTDLAYVTFLGGSSSDYGQAIAVDGAGCTYVTGYTYSSDFPTTTGAFDTSYNDYSDAFMVKVSAGGTDLAYATFLGGSDDDRGYAIAVDGVGCPYVAGMTGSSDFPTTPGAFDTSHNGGWWDAFVAKLAVEPNAQNVELVGQIGVTTNAVAVQGNYAYVGTGFEGLKVIDVSDPANPHEVGCCDTMWFAEDVFVSGSYAYVLSIAEGAGTLRVVDVSDPYNPYEVSGYDPMGFPEGVFFSGFYAYVTSTDTATWVGSLRVVDVSNPYNPYEVGSYDTPGYPRGVFVSGSHAYLAETRDSGLEVVDVSNPASPTAVAFLEGYWANGVYVSDSYAYVAYYQAQLCVVDVSDPTDPTYVSYYSTEAWGEANDVYVCGSHAYLATSGGLLVVDVSDPANPTRIGYYNTPTNAIGIYVSGPYAYLATGDGGLFILRFTGSEPTYSISGRVRDSSGNPISGVTISDGAGHTATTDSNGNYTLSGLAAGTYTITPNKSGYIFSPTSRTVSVPPNATGQDFTGITELIAEIQDVATRTNSRLDQVLAEANEIAQDGDYFAVQKTEHEIDLMADAIIDSASILADGFDTVKKFKDLTKMEFPGVIGSGWGHILELKTNPCYEASRAFFRGALLEEVTPTNVQWAAKEFFNGAHIYYAADMLDTSAENILGEMMKRGWKVGLRSDLALQSRLYPAQQKLVNIFKQDVTDTRDETIANMPWLTPEEQQTYIEDLAQRDNANSVMACTLGQRALPLHLARADRESGQGNWIASFLAKYLIKGLAYLYADGPGVLAVDIGSAFWSLYQNSRQLNEDIKMMNLAVEGMGGSLSAEKRIYLNAVHGMDNIVQGIEPQIAHGSVSSIANRSEGEYKLFGCWRWCERSCYSEVNVSNSTSYDTVYQVIANYGKTGFLGTSYQPLVSEGARAIPGGGPGIAYVYYKQDDEGASPDEGSTIEMDLLGNTDTGTYHVTHESATWNPTRVTTSGVLQVTTQAQAEAPTIPYPIRTRIAVDEDALTYTPYIWMDNPFTQTVAITLTQPLPADVQIIDANGGSIVGNSLRWQRTINPQVTVEITHVVRHLGDAGQVMYYPEPQLEMTDLGATAYVTFTGEAETFISQPPLSAVGTPPAEIVQGETATIPITVTNRLADQAVSGTARLSLIDFEAETEVYSDIRAVSVPASGIQVVNLVVDTANVSEGAYLLTAIVESNGGQEEAFAEYLRVKLYRLYLPLLLRNH